MSNTTTVIGNLSRDPELKYLPNGAATVSFTVADSPRRFDREKNEWVDGVADFVRCTAWEKLAENIAASLKKGDKVLVTGSYQVRKYEDRTTKEEKTVRELKASEVAACLSTQKLNLEKSYAAKGSGNAYRGNNNSNNNAQAASEEDLPF